jgi:hypothetical protein
MTVAGEAAEVHLQVLTKLTKGVKGAFVSFVSATLLILCEYFSFPPPWSAGLDHRQDSGFDWLG